jgi:DNA transformation protein
MRIRSEFVDFVIEQMAPVCSVRARAMFGGYGIYRDDIMFAIIADDRLYLKSDAQTLDQFEALGLPRFSYVARGKTIRLDYFEAPPEVFEDRTAMQDWTQRACTAALRANAPSQRRSK